jgi:hypothetical protein
MARSTQDQIHTDRKNGLGPREKLVHVNAAILSTTTWCLSLLLDQSYYHTSHVSNEFILVVSTQQQQYPLVFVSLCISNQIINITGAPTYSLFAMSKSLVDRIDDTDIDINHNNFIQKTI